MTQLSTKSVRWTGSGTWNGVPGATFTITVVDGKPDTISVAIADANGHPLFSTGGTVPLKGGNITVH